MQLFKAIIKQSFGCSVSLLLFGKGTTWQRGLHGDGVFVCCLCVKKTDYVCVCRSKTKWEKQMGKKHICVG